MTKKRKTYYFKKFYLVCGNEMYPIRKKKFINEKWETNFRIVNKKEFDKMKSKKIKPNQFI